MNSFCPIINRSSNFFNRDWFFRQDNLAKKTFTNCHLKLRSAHHIRTIRVGASNQILGGHKRYWLPRAQINDPSLGKHFSLPLLPETITPSGVAYQVRRGPSQVLERCCLRLLIQKFEGPPRPPLAPLGPLLHIMMIHAFIFSCEIRDT